VRKLVGLDVPDGVPRHGYAVLHDGVEVGKVASGTFSPTLGHGIGTAYVPTALAYPVRNSRWLSAASKRPQRSSVPPFVTRTSLSDVSS